MTKPRFTFYQCGNTIDILDKRGMTVAFLNIGTDTAQVTFDAWLARNDTRKARVADCALWGAIGLFFALVYILSISEQADTYAVILTAHTGNEYVLDYGLSKPECSNAIAADWPDAVCHKEPAQ